MIRDQIVFGTKSKNTREKMLRDKNLTLQKAEDMCKAAEVAEQQNTAWASERVQVDLARRNERSKKQRNRCTQCSKSHPPRQCPAYVKVCYACNRMNHFASCCKNKQVNDIQNDADDHFDVLDVSIYGINNNAGKDWTVRGKVYGCEIELKVDTGSQANLIPLSVFKRMSTTAALQKSNAVLTAYNGSVIKHLGVATTALEINGARKETNFFIVKKGRQAIVGLSTCREIGLIPATVDTIGRSGAEAPETEFAHLFRGTGCVRRKYKMVLRPDAVPVVQPARRVPLALKEPLRDELARMEKAAIIVKVEEPTEWFVPGKDLLLADMLSRAPAYASEPATTEDVEVHAVQVVSGIVSTPTKRRLQAETVADPYLSLVMQQLSECRPVEGELRPFAAELSVIEGILLKGCKVVIPLSMRAEMLKKIHAGHLGMNKCKARARGLVFWPGLDGSIESMIRSCSACQKYAYKQQSEPLILRPTPSMPWYRVGIDIFSFAGDAYLTVYEAHSNFPEVEMLATTTAREVVEKTSAIFARYGIPGQVCTDNGPHFVSKEFADFGKRYDFEHITSSPRFPRSNGLAEKGVQVVKRILKKTTESRDDFWLGLLSYRVSALEDGHSPAQLLQGRQLRTNVPEYRAELGSAVVKHKHQDKGKPLPLLQRGETVRIRDDDWSRKARVLHEVAPRSHIVETEDGRLLRRNRQHLLRTQEEFRAMPNDGNSHDAEGDNAQVVSQDAQVPGSN
ncbi:uncharacterized protein LOC144139592 [Haemaphysalis longicornis]